MVRAPVKIDRFKPYLVLSREALLVLVPLRQFSGNKTARNRLTAASGNFAH
jgi:hypothetical protein